MTKLERAIRRNESGVGWTDLDTEEGKLLHSAQTEKIAAPQAINHLGSSLLGEQLRDYLGDGRMDANQLVPSATEPLLPPPPLPPTLEAVAKHVRAEGKRIDQGLDIGTKVLAGASFIGVPGLATLVSPEVQEAAGDGWWAVMLATFTWSVGCTLSAIVWNRSGLSGMALASATSLCFMVALLIAGALGTGVLDVGAGLATAGSPPAKVLVFVEAAIRTYGPLGAALGLGLGVWLGTRLSPLLDE